MPLVIKAGKNDTTDSIIRKFQKQVAAEGLVQEIRDRKEYQKPSQLRQKYLSERRRKIMRFKRLAE
jgi:ribosomal protein S21